MSLETLDEEAMDRLCWLLVSTRNRFYPPDETAEECIESMVEDANSPEKPDCYSEPDPRTCGNEHGYHNGMFVSRNMFMEQLYGYGINVLGRANRYTYLNRKHGMEFRTGDEPDYYRAVEHGAEVKALRNRESEAFMPDEIETLSWRDPYVPKGADNE